MPQSNAETADRLNRRHARMMPVLAVFVLIQQAVFFTSGNGQRTVDMVRNGAWVVLVSVIALMLVTGGSWFRQLPAGVPGALRIFANLLSAGKTLK